MTLLPPGAKDRESETLVVELHGLFVSQTERARVAAAQRDRVFRHRRRPKHVLVMFYSRRHSGVQHMSGELTRSPARYARTYD